MQIFIRRIKFEEITEIGFQKRRSFSVEPTVYCSSSS